ncbi:ABC transporter permease [Rhodothermus profundi]|uniref:Lipoprotein-releasing system permease protein n=1 Tax=Rhodothermus profundi TaxID=633813 RepID=A0A1M6SP14_9BACT|nr:ABC transporter permease [Rhodothermus profundi]SHK46387.1 lipoprotein-releasing system permease protein [Rhodothermus profundi]
MLRHLYFELFIALRYLRGAQGREEGRRFLRFITYIAIGGVTVGVAALLLALSIVHGFSQEIEAKLTGFGAHVQVENLRDAPLAEASWMEAVLQRMPGVRTVRPVIQEFVLIRRSRREVDGVALWGSPTLPAYLQQHLVAGTASFAPDSLGRPGLIIGRQLAEQLGLRPGHLVTLFSMRHLPTGTRPRVRVRQFYIAGLYETLLADFDHLYVFTSLEAARALLAYGPDEVTRFDLTLQDVQEASHIARQIEEYFGLPVIARTIYEVFRNLFAWVRLQESIIPLVISIIVIVAAFNMLAMLLMVVLEKTREIGILASMGASQQRLQRLYLILGLLTGTIGTLLGELLALGLALLQQQLGIIPLPAEAYYMRTAPVALHAVDFILVAFVTILLCGLASFVPARIAARMNPIQVIRFH